MTTCIYSGECIKCGDENISCPDECFGCMSRSNTECERCGKVMHICINNEWNCSECNPQLNCRKCESHP